MFKENNTKNVEHHNKTIGGSISDYDKIDLINKLMLDRRLSAGDMKVYIFLLNFNNLKYTQEQIAKELSLSRMNVSKSISKLIAFNYISIDKKMLGVSEYKIIEYKNSGISKTDTDGLLKLFNLESKGSDKISSSQMLDIMDNWKKFDKELISICSNVPYSAINAILNNPNSKLILFATYSGDMRIEAFKERYLNNLVEFYLRFANIYDEVFFELYYTLLFRDKDSMNLFNSKYFTIEDVISCGDILHANDIRVSKKFKQDTESKIKQIDEMYKYMRSDDKYDDLELIDDLIYTIRRIDFRNKKFTLEEFLVLIYINNFNTKFERKIGLLFYKFVSAFNKTLAEEFNRLHIMKIRYQDK
ncbi:helix-turn-helix domain-containing protein [Romboutsia sp. 1001713B170207_170306_H8]|uniref:helix-turn-helix domain-containing protein n=1 Tax=Romboutsia sp. 1001713B170207_170306_H8 TaxID=2787112 RepID=UPI001A9BAA96|nr:helix-turn-helix domain-containing protein [Romboutsia sp. 1001713B170207_170306_H8]